MLPLNRHSVRLAVLRKFTAFATVLIGLHSQAGAQTMDKASILDALNPEQLDQQAGTLPRLHSLLISHDNELIFEQYYAGRTDSQPANMKSASKSVISALVGIAIDKGHINSIDEPVAGYFPEYANPESPEHWQSLTIRHLLTMQAGLQSTSGRNYGRWVLSDNWVEAALNRPFVAAPGSSMIYSTGSTHILSAILTRATGMSSREFAQQHLASPMGFRMAYWSQDPQGIYFGGNDMEITPRQMLAFGELYLNDGRYNNTQIVSREWVQESHQSHATSPRGQGRFYGYGWWLREMAGMLVPLAWGYGGQLILVVEEFDLVIVATSDSTPGSDRSGHLRQLYAFMENNILAPLQDKNTLPL
ncbi:MAG: serine hydrolase [Pseudohongiella sp.]|uniref:serine hydrolase domain-containing protein n=1 Tax=Pseudohongiella sp. TaxID=1979412 RepID=UPI0034A03B1D